MRKRFLISIVALLVVSVVTAPVSFAAQKESFGTKVASFWKNLLGYPGRVTEESASVVAGAIKGSAGVVSNATKRLGEVTTGDVAKTKELVTEPITGTAETVGKAAEGTIKMPSEALKEKPRETTQPAPAPVADKQQ